MKGDARVIELLNQALLNELTAINQYWLHYRLLEHWGVKRLAEHERHESIDEMKHADWLAISRNFWSSASRQRGSRAGATAVLRPPGGSQGVRRSRWPAMMACCETSSSPNWRYASTRRNSSRASSRLYSQHFPVSIHARSPSSFGSRNIHSASTVLVSSTRRGR